MGRDKRMDVKPDSAARVIARSGACVIARRDEARHCEERSDEAIQTSGAKKLLDCFTARSSPFAMTFNAHHCERSEARHCGERSDEAIQTSGAKKLLDCFTARSSPFAMTFNARHCERSEVRHCERSEARHCEERSDEAIQTSAMKRPLDCFMARSSPFAMTRSGFIARSAFI